jgi:hypothetical protein
MPPAMGGRQKLLNLERRTVPMKSRAILIAVVLTLFPAAFAHAQASPTTKPTAGAKPTTKPLPAGQVMDSMLKPMPNAGQPLQPIPDAPRVDTSSGQAAVAPAAPKVNLVREGTFIVDRAGRLTKSADGLNMELTFDSDGQSLQDPPLIILPNLNLMSMEDAVTSGSRDLKFRVTGVITEYHGRNYILLDKVVVVPDPTAQF